MAGVALGYATLVREFALAPALGWLVAVPITFASYSLIAGVFGVCASSALRGERYEDHGREAILDQANRREVRNRALVVVSLSLLIAGVLAIALVENA